MNDLNLIWLKLSVVVSLLVMMVVSVGFMALDGGSFSDSLQRGLTITVTAGQYESMSQIEAENLIVRIAVFGGGISLMGMVGSLIHLGAAYRRQRARHRRMRFAKRLFFSDIGVELLRSIACLDIGACYLQQALQVSPEWRREDFDAALNLVVDRHHPIDSRCGGLAHLRETLEAKSGLLLRLLEDPVVRECKNLPALVETVSRLRDEMTDLDNSDAMAPSARLHLERAITETYELLTIEWLRYVQQLGTLSKGLYVQAVRANPFGVDAPAAQ